MSKFTEVTHDIFTTWWVVLPMALVAIVGIALTVFWWIAMAPFFGILCLVCTILCLMVLIGLAYIVFTPRY